MTYYKWDLISISVQSQSMPSTEWLTSKSSQLLLVSDLKEVCLLYLMCYWKEHSCQLVDAKNIPISYFQWLLIVDLIMDILVKLIGESPPPNIIGIDHSLYCVVGESEGFWQTEFVAADGQSWWRGGLCSQENESHAGDVMSLYFMRDDIALPVSFLPFLFWRKREQCSRWHHEMSYDTAWHVSSLLILYSQIE